MFLDREMLPRFSQFCVANLNSKEPKIVSALYLRLYSHQA